MAYNVLKGKVDGSVDQHANQEIGGVKIFKNAISASVFYDTDAQSPCATMKDIAVQKVKSQTVGGVMVWDGNGEAATNRKLRFNGDTLTTYNLVAKTLRGSAAGLTNIPPDQFDAEISAKYINHGAGLHNVRGSLQIKASHGIQVEDGSLSLALQPNSGLALKSNKLLINPALTPPINTGGQNLSDQDVLMVADISRNKTTSTTLQNLYDNYIRLKMPQAAGEKHQIQFRGAAGFAASPNLMFDDKHNTMEISGKVKAHEISTAIALRCNGAVYKNITKTTDKNYAVDPEDYTIVCDTSKNSVNIELPTPCNNEGRLLVVKKIDANKYKLASNTLKITCEDGRIEISNEITVKMNYSSRTLQCDGENWWIIGSNGS